MCYLKGLYKVFLALVVFFLLIVLTIISIPFIPAKLGGCINKIPLDYLLNHVEKYLFN